MEINRGTANGPRMGTHKACTNLHKAAYEPAQAIKLTILLNDRSKIKIHIPEEYFIHFIIFIYKIPPHTFIYIHHIPIKAAYIVIRDNEFMCST